MDRNYQNRQNFGESHIPSKLLLMRSEDKALGWHTLCTAELAPLFSAGGPPDDWGVPLCLWELVPASLIPDWDV